MASISRRPSRGASPRDLCVSLGQAGPRQGSPALLGDKGAMLNRLAAVGLPVPPGFTITTTGCAGVLASGGTIPPPLSRAIVRQLAGIENLTGGKFGSAERPLLLAVRTGSATDARGLLRTVLDIGMNDAILEAQAQMPGAAPFACDCYRRLIASFGSIVTGIFRDEFDRQAAEILSRRGARSVFELDRSALAELVQRHREVYRFTASHPFPQEPMEQLAACIRAAALSWNSPVAAAHRRKHNLPAECGVAITIQAMVFGNHEEGSAAGAATTRDCRTGERRITGEFILQGQGTDLAGGAGIPLDELGKELPAGWTALERACEQLERESGDVQEVHFALEDGRAWLLDARPAGRTPQAAVRFAVELAQEGFIDRRAAVLRVEPHSLEALLHPVFDAASQPMPLASGNAASPGCASGCIVFDADEAAQRAAAGEKLLLVRTETSASDVIGMQAVEGLLTTSGGMTSHAAIEARALGVPCITGAGAITIDADAEKLFVNGRALGARDWLSIDGTRGLIFAGRIDAVAPAMSSHLSTLLAWADEYRRIEIRANADTPDDALAARELGAQGIGLCRTEHMFFEPRRIGAMREMILAESSEARRKALAKLLPFQREDFTGIFKAMAGLPVTIRLLDPPLHEFLPRADKEQRALAESMGMSLAAVRRRIAQLAETNPMLGHRGDRLAITRPEILEMQVRAIIEAACRCAREGLAVRPEIMVPLAGTRRELELCRQWAAATAQRVMAEQGVVVEWSLGTMIEVPRAALVADELAEVAEFFSFGTNDLTQMTFGYSRDDASSFLPQFLDKQVLDADPFTTLDQRGVGKLIEMAIQLGRRSRTGLKCGLCGEHGGDAPSIEFCCRAGMNYVSCSPYRVPIARLAAGQAGVKMGEMGDSRGGSAV